MSDNDDLLKTFEEISKTFNEAMDEVEKESEEYWNSLSKEDQLKAFCAVSRRIYQGELVKRGTYRYVLYDVFGFGPEAYAPAQMANYLEIHNALYGADTFDKMEAVNRIEVIDTDGRAYTRHLSNRETVEYHLQDDDKTLKVFINPVGAILRTLENKDDNN
jgi:hypothetical protein